MMGLMAADPIKMEALALVAMDPPGTWTPDHLAERIDESRGYVFAVIDDLMDLGAIAWHGRGEGLIATGTGMRIAALLISREAALA